MLLAIAPAKHHFADWHVYQRGYERLIAKRSDAVTLHRHFQSGIQQIWLPEMGVVDRCTTCHSALKEPTLADVAIQPYRPHPAIPHKPEEFGCVICHRGQGLATTVEEAHQSTLAWEEPLTAGEVSGVIMRTVPPAGPEGHSAVEPWPQDAAWLRLCSLPHGQATGWQRDQRYG